MVLKMEMRLKSEIVVSLRKEKLWSQQHLADACGVSLRTIQRAENNGIASFETLKALSAVLEIDSKVILLKKKAAPIRKFSLRNLAYAVSLVVTLIGGVSITSTSIASSNIQIQGKSVVIFKDKNTTTFNEDVTMTIPEEANFEITVLDNSDTNGFSVKIVSDNAHFFVAKPTITKVNTDIMVTSSKVKAIHVLAASGGS